MQVLLFKDGEAGLVDRKSNAVSDHLAEEKVVASHEIVHDVLLSWYESLLVDDDKVDPQFGDHLDSDVASDVKDVSIHVKECIVLGPKTCVFVLLEEKNVRR